MGSSKTVSLGMANAEEVLKEGLLKKKSPSFLRGWQMRSFRLYDASLQFSEPEEWAPASRQVIELRHIEEIQLDAKFIHIYTSSRIYHLMAETDEEAREWVQDVRSVAFHAKPICTSKSMPSSSSMDTSMSIEATLSFAITT